VLKWWVASLVYLKRLCELKKKKTYCKWSSRISVRLFCSKGRGDVAFRSVPGSTFAASNAPLSQSLRLLTDR